MLDNKSDALQLVQKYQELVLLYESLDKEIDSLIMAYGGASEKMPPEVLSQYRSLAQKRDDTQNEMRELEHELSIDEE
ncbi:MAG: hypothetical protein R3E39_02200 [Anaerolineae bacterium]